MKVHSVVLVCALLLAGCAAQPTRSEPDGVGTTGGSAEPAWQAGGDARLGPNIDLGSDALSQHTLRAYAQYKKIYAGVRGQEQSTGIPDSGALHEFVGSGIAYVDDRCQKYFAALNLYYKEKKEQSKAVNLVTAGITAIMAALRSAASEIAAIAVGGTSAAALIDNSGSRLLYELDPATTQSLVTKAKDLYQRNITQDSVVSFQQALIVVQGYADLCTPSTIERMVQEAVAGGTAKTGASAADQLRVVGSRAARDQLAGALHAKGNLSDNEVLALFWLVELGGANDAEARKVVARNLGSDLRETFFVAGKDDLQPGAPLTTVKTALRELEAIDVTLRSRASRFKDEQTQKDASALPAGAPGGRARTPAVNSGTAPFARPFIYF